MAVINSVFRRAQTRHFSTPTGELLGAWKPHANGASYLTLARIRIGNKRIRRPITWTQGFVRPLETGGYAVVLFDPASPFESSEWPRHVVASEIEAVEALESMAVMAAIIGNIDEGADDGIYA